MIGKLPDPRLPGRIVYSKEHLFFLGLSMFLFHCGSRSQLESDRKTPAFRRNLQVLSGTGEDCVASTDTMNYLMEKMDPSCGMELLCGEMVSTLIRSRALDRYRNSNGEFMVAMDGVHLFTRKGEHPGSVRKTIDGKRRSYYYALEAKLVTGDGMGLSLATVFIETKEEYNKEDCELNAFYRLEKILKSRFPRLPLCILLDSLYSNQNVLRICAGNNWGYAIMLKEGSIPSLYEAAVRQAATCLRQSVDHSPEEGCYQHVSWAVNMRHGGNFFHVLICEETCIEKDGIKKSRFVWEIDSRPDKNNAVQLAKEARCRWVVEEMFNIQKHGGYELEHSFGTVGFAMKNYYYLLQLAHMLNQLMVRSDLFPKLQRKFILREFGKVPEQARTYMASVAETTLENFRTIKNFVRRMAESFRNQDFSELARNPEALGKIQIRFSSA